MVKVSASDVMPRAPIVDIEAITEIAKTDLIALRGARIFITGGTGYIGRWLMESLCYANSVLGLSLSITVLSRNPKNFSKKYPHLGNNSCVSFVEGDVRDFSFDERGFSHVIHAATDVVTNVSALDMFDVTVMGTRRVLEFASHQDGVDVLLLSSGAVYGTFPKHVHYAAESLPCVTDVKMQQGAYGLGKIATEWLGNAYGQQYGFSCKSARVFAQIGPYLELGAHFAAGNFIRDVLRAETIIINGDGTSQRSYMHAIDMVVWLLAILVRGEKATAYNVGSEEGISILELAQSIVRVACAEQVGIQVLGHPAPGAAPSRYLPDTALARECLGLSITVPLEEAIKRTLEWYRLHEKRL